VAGGVTGATVSYAQHKLDTGVPEVPIPDGYRERLESLFGGRRDLVVALAVVAAIVGAILLLRFRTPPPRIAPPATAPAPAPSAPASTAAPTGDPTPGELFVHVAGAVREPGLYRLPNGSRVADAIEVAGGPTARGDVDALNLAELVVDGAKIEVPQRGGANAAAPAAPTPAASTPAGSTPAPSVIDINTADATALETIPGIGPVLAAAIVQHRDENGPFPSVDALLDVSGIGPATLESVRPYVRV
jgi:competence protein ComEA